MSGLVNKVKDAVGKSGKSDQIEKGADNQLNKGIDTATDRAGLGDKYDQKIDQFADKQLNNQIPGGQGAGGAQQPPK